jgi:FkbM family methyltransferase
MNFYSQNNEDKIIREFIKDKNTGNVLDIGANDGKLFSNSLHFIENGWGGTLIEASPIAFIKMQNLHKDNELVQCIEACLDTQSRETTFYHNLNHCNAGDTDLLSTINKESYLSSSTKFPFKTFKVLTKTFTELVPTFKHNKYSIISIDVEGIDLEILKQINLQELGCEIIIVEYNNDINKRAAIREYCSIFNITNILYDWGTNIIITA